MLSNRVVVIGITGRSGSGKTTAANKVAKHFGSKAVVVPTDRYYKGRTPEQSREEFNQITNFDAPDALDLKKLAEHIKQLKAGKDVYLPHYDMKTSLSTDNAELVTARSVIIIEGIFALEPELLDVIDISVFVHAPSDIALARRCERDFRERNYSHQHTVGLVINILRPSYDLYLKPKKNTAHIRLDNTANVSDTGLINVDVITDLIEKKMKAGVLLMIMGPSGAGKSTIINKIIADSDSNITKVVNYTTREKRAGEVDGVDYHFISRAEFKQKLDEGFFISSIVVGNHFYATADFTESLLAGKNWIMDCLPPIARSMRAKLPHHCHTIFVNAESLEILKARMQSRGEAEAEIAERMLLAGPQIKECKEAANFSLINSDLNTAVSAVKALIPRKTITFLAHNDTLPKDRFNPTPAPAVGSLGCN